MAGAMSIDGAREIVRGQAPGRYGVDENRAEPFRSGHTSRSWGRLIRHPHGRVEVEPWPWDQPDS
jgi:hypothetical protein